MDKINTVELEVAICRAGKNKEQVARQLQLSPSGFSKKIHGHNEFKTSEIAKLSKILELNSADRDLIFFDIKYD
jgi:hypothetical protein